MSTGGELNKREKRGWGGGGGMNRSVVGKDFPIGSSEQGVLFFWGEKT